MTFIAIDLGTSFIKGAVLDLDARRLDHIHRFPFPDPLPGLHPLFREFDPQQVLTAVRALLADLAPYAANCEGLVMCNQMHGLVFTTEKGEPRSTLTTWQDQRVLMPHPSGKGTYFDVMKARLSPDELRQLGSELRVGLPVGLFFWMAEQGQLPGQEVIAAALPDFVLSNLCQSPATIEATNAMAHGALNLETMDWHHEVIGKLGLEHLRWPELRRHGEVVGYLKLGSQNVPCYTPIGDYQAAILGSLLRYGELSLNISTGSQASLMKPGPEFGDFQTRPFFDGRFLITITHIPAGRALNALVRLLTELAVAQHIELADPWPYIARAAAAAGKPDLRMNLAFFTSSCGDQGEITHIREEELTVGHLFRAAFQNMTDNYYASALRLSPQKEWTSLVFSGGLAQKIDTLRQLICDQFAVPYRVCPSSEDTLLGLMALAMAFTGRAASVEQAANILYDTYDAG